ncbi:MAG: DNA polymerase IV [Clostridia bacterium]|nr:DNA polymerase IV [Clostridia bacterium]
MKHILLVDMNAFFIMCESLLRPELRDIPAAVAGDPLKRTGIILTANYIARKYGVYTTMTVNQAKNVCPSIELVKPSSGLYSKCSNQVFDIFRRYTPTIEQASIDEGWLDITESTDLFGSPFDIASRIQNEVKDELGLWCSVGISENKFLSKMACEMKKPLGITTMYQKDIEKMLWPLPVNKMYGVGKATSKQLLNVGIHTIGDIANCDKVFLTEKFGSFGSYLYERANGIDHSLVGVHQVKSKSISKEHTLAADMTDINQAKKALINLAQEVGVKARAEGLKGETVQITMKYSNFISVTRQKKVHATNLDKEILKAGYELLEENWDSKKPIRLIGIGLHNMTGQKAQVSFFDNHIEVKEEKIEKTMDTLNIKYGKKSLKRGSNL